VISIRTPLLGSAFLALLAGLAVIFSPLSAQKPAPPKPPVFPPFNPAIAKLDQTITGLDGPGFCIAYGDTAEVLYVGCEKGTIQSWHKDVLMSIRKGSGTSDVLRGHQGPVLALAWNGGPVLASLGIDRKILLWSVKEGAVLQAIASPTILRALAISPDGKLLAGGGEDPAVQLWDLPAGKPAAKLTDHQDWVTALAFSPDSKQLASADYHGKVILWDVPDGKKVRSLTPLPSPPPKELPDPVPAEALAFSPDGKSVAVGSANGNIQIVNVADGKLVRAMPGHTSAVTSIAFHPSGNLMVSASKDRTLRLWNPTNGQAIKTLEGHEAWVEGVAFTARGTRIASVGADQTVRLWDLAEPTKK
jgi:WD40 repeat protein